MEKTIRWFERVCLALAITSVVAIMLLVSYDSIVRYVTHRPLPWTFQLISYYLMGFALYLAISATFQNGDHIALDLFRPKFSPLVRRITDLLWGILATGTFVLISYGAWNQMLHAYITQEFMPGHIIWPAWLAFAPVVLGAGVFVLRLLQQCYALVSGDHVVAVKFETEIAE